MKSLSKLIVVLGFLGLVMIPGLATADQIVMQTQATAASAVGGQNATIASPALISLVVTKEGFPESTLGEDVGDGNTIITLPKKNNDRHTNGTWRLRTIATPDPDPASGCVLVPTQFDNMGGGVYQIQVKSQAGPNGCGWVQGDYQFVVSYGPSKGRRGSVLGTLTIPPAPAAP